MGVRGKRDLPCRINGSSCYQGSGNIYPSKWDCSPGQWGSAASFSPGGVLHDPNPRAGLACGAWKMGRTHWECCSWNSCLVRFGCKSLIPQEHPGFALGRSCPTQGPGAAGGAAVTEWDTGCACPREGCTRSPRQPGMSMEQPARLPLLACLFPSRLDLHSAGFLWGFFPYYTFQTPSGLEMISSDAGGESQPASALRREMELP